ncbi:MAG TPA: hypothetical protein V6D02_08660, partial [Candidatus Obscuribacterales bacterium]
RGHPRLSLGCSRTSAPVTVVQWLILRYVERLCVNAAGECSWGRVRCFHRFSLPCSISPA